MKIRCFPHCCARIWDSSQWHVQSLTASYISTLQIHQIRTWARRRGLQEGEEGGRYEEMHACPLTYKEEMWAAQLFLPPAAKPGDVSVGLGVSEKIEGTSAALFTTHRDKPSNLNIGTIFELHSLTVLIPPFCWFWRQLPSRCTWA